MRNVAPPVSGRLGYPLGFAVAIAVMEVTVVARGTEHTWVALGVLAVTVAAVAAVTTLRAALAGAVFTWGLFAGFLVGRHGELAFTWSSAVGAVVLPVAVLAGYGLSAVVRAQ
jgi:hypothetical protein